MISKSILWRYQVFVAAVIAGMTLFSGNVSAVEKDDIFRKTDWDENERYIIRAVPFSKGYNPEDKITFIGCDTQENYDKYMQALRSNESDDVLAGLRSNNKCQVLTNSDVFYYVRIEEMDEKTRKVTQVARDFDGIIEEPLFTNITLEKKLIRYVPKNKEKEELGKKFQEKYLAKWKDKIASLEHDSFFCRSFYDYRKYKYDRALNPRERIGITERRYKNDGRCFEIEKGTQIKVVFENRYRNVEYQILSGKYKDKMVYADDNIALLK